MASELVADRCRRLARIRASVHESEKRPIADTLCVCDAKLRLACMALRLYCLRQDAAFETVDGMGHALDGLIGRINAIPVAPMKRFARPLSQYERETLTGYLHNANDAKAEALSRKTEDMERITDGMRGFNVTGKRILMALGRKDAHEGGSACIIRKENAEGE